MLFDQVIDAGVRMSSASKAARQRCSYCCLALRAGRLRRPRLARCAAAGQGRRHGDLCRKPQAPRHKLGRRTANRTSPSFSTACCAKMTSQRFGSIHAVALLSHRARSDTSENAAPCTTFTYKAGVLHAEDVDLASIADAVGTPFYCYSTATLERHYQVLAKAFAGPERAHLLCRQGQLQPGGAGDARAARRRHGRRLGRRAAPRPRRRRSRRQDHLRRRRQDARRDGLRAEGRHPRLQRRKRARTRAR